MNPLILCCGWYLIACSGLSALHPSQPLLEGPTKGDKLYAIAGSKTGHEVQIHSASTASALNPTGADSLKTRFEALHVLAPVKAAMESEAEPEAPPKNWLSKLFRNNSGKRTRSINELLADLPEGVQRSDVISSIAAKLRLMVKDNKFQDSLFVEGSELHEVMVTALEYLQRDDLQTNERLWTLSVLHEIQSYLPKGQLKRIRQDPNTGHVSRGGLELFLTEGLDCMAGVEHTSNKRGKSSRREKAITEALKRVELILSMKNVIENSKTQMYGLEEIHNKLLQQGSLTKYSVEISVWGCIAEMSKEETTLTEMKFLHDTVEFLKTFYPDYAQPYLEGLRKRPGLETKKQYHVRLLEEHPGYKAEIQMKQDGKGGQDLFIPPQGLRDRQTLDKDKQSGENNSGTSNKLSTQVL